MTKPNDPSINEAPPSADELRMIVIEAKLAEMQRLEKARDAERKKMDEFTADFLGSDVSEKEIKMIRSLVMNAVRNGAFEALVYSFSSDLCTDSGRAINNADPRWPETLQGKARQLYERFETFGRPQGYKLVAKIISFPGGMPGDVGFFINWRPK